MKKGPYFVQPGLGNIAEESVVPAKVQHFPGDVGIGPTSPPQGIAGQKPIGPVTDYGHGTNGSGSCKPPVSLIPPYDPRVKAKKKGCGGSVGF